MIDLVLTRCDLLDEVTFQRMRATVPAERQRKSDGYLRQQDRYASVVAFSLLQQLWRERCPDPMPRVVTGAYGKPAFEGERTWHFNWSHDAAVCACALGPVPIGVDVQSRVPFDVGLFERMAAPSEHLLRDLLRREDDLSPLWTRKEAVVKRTGRGLSIPLQSVDTLAEADLVTLSCGDPDFRLSVSAEGVIEQDPRVRCLGPAADPALWSDAPHPWILHSMSPSQELMFAPTKSSGVNSRGSTSTIQLPELSRISASIP